MCKFHICATRRPQQEHGHKVSPIRGLAMFFWPCEKQPKTSRDRPFIYKGSSHVFSFPVLADGRCLKAYVPPRTGIGLLRSCLW